MQDSEFSACSVDQTLIFLCVNVGVLRKMLQVETDSVSLLKAESKCMCLFSYSHHSTNNPLCHNN